MRVIDLTHTILEDMPVYPGTPPPRFEPVYGYEEDGFRETRISLFTHTGTHVDPPAHIFPGRTTLDRFPIGQFIGKALVIDCRRLAEGDPITMGALERYGDRAKRADFLLFCLGWDRRWGMSSYYGDYPCLDEEVLDYIVEGEYKGIGFDVLGLDPIGSLTRHKKLFREKDILNIENLCNLDQCGDDLFWFSCFPLKLGDCDGSPCRAAAWFE